MKIILKKYKKMQKNIDNYVLFKEKMKILIILNNQINKIMFKNQNQNWKNKNKLMKKLSDKII